MEYKEVIFNNSYEYLRSEYKIGAFKFIDKYYNGEIESIEYVFNGKTHRENAPAFTSYEDGKITKEIYYLFNIYKYL